MTLQDLIDNAPPIPKPCQPFILAVCCNAETGKAELCYHFPETTRAVKPCGCDEPKPEPSP
jgi:hypothetical protein